MEEKTKCEICDRTFNSEEGLMAHNKAKHPEKVPKERKPLPVKKIRNWGIFILIVGLIVWGIFMMIQNTLPEGEDFSKAIPVIGDEHVSVGSQLIGYNSNPPTSGPHYDTPARPGFRENVIEDRYLIHSMEHGLVWISYHPRIGEEAEKLRDVVGPLTVITQRESNDEDIAIASWGRLDAFNLDDGTIDEDDLQRIKDFIKRHAENGPEKVPAGQHGGI